MTRRWGCVVAVLAVLAVTGLTRADDKNTEAGTYTFVSVIHDGKEVPADELKTYVLTLTESKYTVKKGDQVLEEGTYKVDRNKTPFQLERTASTGDNKGKTFLGICEQTGDTMKVCWGAPNGDRPTEFSSKSGSGHVLEVIKRSGK